MRVQRWWKGALVTCSSPLNSFWKQRNNSLIFFPVLQIINGSPLRERCHRLLIFSNSFVTVLTLKAENRYPLIQLEPHPHPFVASNRFWFLCRYMKAKLKADLLHPQDLHRPPDYRQTHTHLFQGGIRHSSAVRAQTNRRAIPLVHYFPAFLSWFLSNPVTQGEGRNCVPAALSFLLQTAFLSEDPVASKTEAKYIHLKMLSATGRTRLPVRSFCPPPVVMRPWNWVLSYLLWLWQQCWNRLLKQKNLQTVFDMPMSRIDLSWACDCMQTRADSRKSWQIASEVPIRMSLTCSAPNGHELH